MLACVTMCTDAQRLQFALFATHQVCASGNFGNISHVWAVARNFGTTSEENASQASQGGSFGDVQASPWKWCKLPVRSELRKDRIARIANVAESARMQQLQEMHAGQNHRIGNLPMLAMFAMSATCAMYAKFAIFPMRACVACFLFFTKFAALRSPDGCYFLLATCQTSSKATSSRRRSFSGTRLRTSAVPLPPQASNNTTSIQCKYATQKKPSPQEFERTCLARRQRW